MVPLLSIPSPDSSTIELGPLSIHFYGLTLLAAIAAAVVIAGMRWTRRGGDWDLIFRVAVWGVAFGIIGARLYHVVTSWDELPDEWWYRVYAGVIVTTIVVITLLWAFSRYFSG